MPMRAPTPVHLDLPSWSELRVVARSIARVLADSTRTLDIVVAEEISAKAQVRYLRDELLLATEEGRALLADRPELSAAQIEPLRALPDGTFGREFARFLDLHGLDYDIDLAAPRYIEDEDAHYVLRRYRKTHDIFHVLLGLGVEGHEEVLVHAFTLAQMGMPSSVAIVFFGAIKHMLLEGRLRCLARRLPEAFEAGRRAAPLLSVRFESHFDEPLESVRERYRIPTLGP
jgi:ubiquinone biosynthesis protein COQ4